MHDSISQTNVICPGNGTCLEQQSCDCSDYDDIVCQHGDDEECECYDGIVPSCGHDGGTYVSSGDCCEPLPCDNYGYGYNCKNLLPLWLKQANYGMCFNCAALLGPHSVQNEKEECPVCFSIEANIVLACHERQSNSGGHKICRACWNSIKLSGGGNRDSCPLCRAAITWQSPTKMK